MIIKPALTPKNKMKLVFFVILLIIPILLMALMFHHSLLAEELNQTEYCHDHYSNGTVLCHKMPMNMTMPVSEQN